MCFWIRRDQKDKRVIEKKESLTETSQRPNNNFVSTAQAIVSDCCCLVIHLLQTCEPICFFTVRVPSFSKKRVQIQLFIALLDNGTDVTTKCMNWSRGRDGESVSLGGHQIRKFQADCYVNHRVSQQPTLIRWRVDDRCSMCFDVRLIKVLTFLVTKESGERREWGGEREKPF